MARKILDNDPNKRANYNFCDSVEAVRADNTDTTKFIPAEQLNEYLARIYPHGMRAFISQANDKGKLTYAVCWLSADREIGYETNVGGVTLKIVDVL